MNLGIVTPEQAEADALHQRRLNMQVYALAFEDACDQTPFGESTLMDAVETLLTNVSPRQQRRYSKITIFERLRPEVKQFLMGPEINLSPEQVDALFELAMEIERLDPDVEPA